MVILDCLIWNNCNSFTNSPAIECQPICLSFHPDAVCWQLAVLKVLVECGTFVLGIAYDTQWPLKGILSTDWSANGYSLVTGGEDCQMLLWDLRKATKAGQLLSHTNSIIHAMGSNGFI